MDIESTLNNMNQRFKKTFRGVTNEIQQCIDTCLLCHKTCEEIIPYCLERGGMHAERAHIEKLLACADVCRTSAHLMMWHSDFHSKVCRVCSEVCEQCAKDCERMKNDEMMKMCADICHQCAQSCEKMANQH